MERFSVLNLVIELGAGRQEELIDDKVTFLRYICFWQVNFNSTIVSTHC